MSATMHAILFRQSTLPARPHLATEAPARSLVVQRATVSPVDFSQLGLR